MEVGVGELEVSGLPAVEGLVVGSVELALRVRAQQEG